MFFGVGLPILYPLAAIDLLVIWLTERFFIARVYRKTPSLSSKLTDNMIEWISYTPILFLLNGFWMVSNRQMFDNVVNKIAYTTQNMITNHSVSSVRENALALPMLIIGLALLTSIILYKVIPQTL